MKIEEVFEVTAAASDVFRGLNDVGSIGYCVAGVTDVKVVNDDESLWRVEQRFGTIARTFNLDARIVERRVGQRIAFTAKAQEVEVNGHVALVPLAADLTRCEVQIEVDIIGPLASFAATFAKGPQRKLIEQTLNNLRERLEGAVLEEIAAVPGAAGLVSLHSTGKPPRKRILARMAEWVRRLLRLLNVRCDKICSLGVSHSA